MSEKAEAVRPYSYFDTPDGQDVDKKVMSIIRPVAVASAVFATADIMMYSHPKTYLSALGRFGYMSLPLIGIATGFVAVTNTVCNFRGKDDMYNWAIGGAAAGSMLGVWTKRPGVGFAAAAFFATLAMIKKDAHDNGWELTPSKISHCGRGLRGPTNDFSLCKDIPSFIQK